MSLAYRSALRSFHSRITLRALPCLGQPRRAVFLLENHLASLPCLGRPRRMYAKESRAQKAHVGVGANAPHRRWPENDLREIPLALSQAFRPRARERLAFTKWVTFWLNHAERRKLMTKWSFDAGKPHVRPPRCDIRMTLGDVR